MDSFQAEVLGIQLPHLPAWTMARRRIARLYREGFAGLDSVQLPVEREGARHNWHIFAVCAAGRDRFRNQLARRGIRTAVHYPTPAHMNAAYRRCRYPDGAFPVAEALCETEVTLPMFPELTDAEAERVIEAVRASERVKMKRRRAAA
jgi:dTDP-4-amino-4,6-dideoxygalactose transaminase